MSNERQRIQLDLNKGELGVLEVALSRYAVDHPDTEGYHIALSIKDAVHNEFYKAHYQSLIRKENDRLGYIPCRLCSAKLHNIIDLVQHVRWGHSSAGKSRPTVMFPDLEDAMKLIYSWYKEENETAVTVEDLWQQWERQSKAVGETVPAGVPLTQHVWDRFCSYAYSFGIERIALVMYGTQRWHADNRRNVITKRKENLDQEL